MEGAGDSQPGEDRPGVCHLLGLGRVPSPKTLWTPDLGVSRGSIIEAQLMNSPSVSIELSPAPVPSWEARLWGDGSTL